MGKNPLQDMEYPSYSTKESDNAALGCNLKNSRMVSVCFQGTPFNITVTQVVALTSNAEEAEVEWSYEDLKDLLELTTKKEVMLKILQARLQEYMNCELPDVQAGFSESRGTKDQIANFWIIEKAREFQKNTCFSLFTMPKPLCGLQQTVEHSERDGNTRPSDLRPAS